MFLRLILLTIICPVFSFSNSFLQSLYPSYRLARDLSKRGNIDNSHNHHHSKEVLFWSVEIIKRLPFEMSKHDILITGQCALLHDLVDQKYTDFSKDVEYHLQKYHTADDIRSVMKIIQNMSYSKIVSNDGQVSFPSWVEHSSLCKIYHVVREADLLSSYNLARMIEYRKKLSNYTEEKIKEEVMELYEHRMKRLVERGLFYFNTTIPLAQTLEEVSRLKLSILPYIHTDDNLDILRIVNHLSIHDIIYRMETI
jgi:HD superfamily phosphodiesterase